MSDVVLAEVIGSTATVLAALIAAVAATFAAVRTRAGSALVTAVRRLEARVSALERWLPWSPPEESSSVRAPRHRAEETGREPSRVPLDLAPPGPHRTPPRPPAGPRTPLTGPRARIPAPRTPPTPSKHARA